MTENLFGGIDYHGAQSADNERLADVVGTLAVYGADYDNAFWDGNMLFDPDTFELMEYQDDATIDQHRYPNPRQRVLISMGEAGAGNLPDDDELAARGVERKVLAYELRKGMDARLFTRALHAGLVDVGAFNNLSLVWR